MEILLGSERGALAAQVVRANAVVAPAHLDAEAYRALRRLRRQRVMSTEALALRVRSLSRLAVERIPLPPLLQSANELGDRFSPPDSLYVALARALDAEFVTCDAPLATACEGVARVRLI